MQTAAIAPKLMHHVDALATGALATGALATGANSTAARELDVAIKGDEGALREAFDNFVGQTFFGQLLKAMRSSVDKPAYFHGGRAEEVFQGQLDQVLAEKMTKASAEQFTGPMFELFQLRQM